MIVAIYGCDSKGWMTKEINQMAYGVRGSFSSRSAFLSLINQNGASKSHWLNLISKASTPKKVKVFLWFSMYRSLNTTNRLQRRFPFCTLSHSFCCLCSKGEETIAHVLFIVLLWPRAGSSF